MASGTSGGTLAPILLISAGYGSLFGAAFVHLFPGIDVSPGAFAVVAMAATFGAATAATFTAIVFVFELTRDYDVILPMMLATVVADLIAGVLMRDSIMTEKLTRRGLRVHTDFEVDRFRTVPVSEIMTSAVHTLPEAATVGARAVSSPAAATARIPSSTTTDDVSASSRGVTSSSLTTMPTRSRCSSTRAGTS